jgi:chromosome segregation ATPase
VEAVRRATGSLPVADGGATGGEEAAELRAEVTRLEDELEQMSARLRHAYAQVESSEAMVTSARGNGQLPPEVAELHDLRREVQQLRRDQLETVARMRDAERRSADLQSELAAAANGNGNGSTPAPTESSDDEGSEIIEGESSAAARSLRSRLAQTASRKKGDKPEPDSGFGA